MCACDLTRTSRVARSTTRTLRDVAEVVPKGGHAFGRGGPAPCRASSRIARNDLNSWPIRARRGCARGARSPVERPRLGADTGTPPDEAVALAGWSSVTRRGDATDARADEGHAGGVRSRRAEHRACASATTHAPPRRASARRVTTANCPAIQALRARPSDLWSGVAGAGCRATDAWRERTSSHPTSVRRRRAGPSAGRRAVAWGRPGRRIVEVANARTRRRAVRDRTHVTDAGHRHRRARPHQTP